ncbi:transglutaminase family protein [Rivihabitans pingtungensis]|jgi:transglutaminase-like putative cysteine protease|uniref:Transglutaminase-like putative cysteine protease n=2 Tax=Rivihabitans pingtungensis TaxID=1054498 RepID=A0A318KWS0_9NEIS|nr:transglutaminase family protein [Rivihabitans pingtungensis]MCK6435374.1 transglutaminase family protein [Rivihabitans pingtungensis]PXX77663.1 transglutaminase-like putative cysteine protease [Rivihabitans pingtungensis]
MLNTADTVLHISHVTHYDYASRVDLAMHLLHLQPLSRADQQLEDFRLDIDPPATRNQASLDYFGNPQHHLTLTTPHHALTVRAESRVRRLAAATPKPSASPAWESVRAAMRYRAGQPWLPAAEFCFPSAFVPLHPAFQAYAQLEFTPGRPLLEAAIGLMARIHHEFTYATASTDLTTPALEAFSRRQGVCQDFAHIMIACLRSLGLPARYVSGYLLTQPPPGQPRLLGVDASHAWLAVWCPQHDWVELDPTNNLIAAQSHAVIACGRDYADVAPLRGVIQGGGSHTLSVAVSVVPEGEAVFTPSVADQD